MPHLFQRTIELYQLLKSYPSITPNPDVPQANMLHLHLPISQLQATMLRDRMAQEYQVWIGNPQQGMLKKHSYIEWYVGDTLLEMSDHELKNYLQLIEDGCQ